MYPEDHDPNASSKGSLAELLIRMPMLRWLLGNLPVRTASEKQSVSGYGADEPLCKELADAAIGDLRRKALISSMLHAASSRWQRG